MNSKRLRPLIGVSACLKDNGRSWVHSVGDKYVQAAIRAVGGLPVIIPAFGGEFEAEQGVVEALDRLLDNLDGVPLIAICRGAQEVNVALGGTLHQLVHEVPGRRDHRSPKTNNADINYAAAHAVEIVEGGLLHRLIGERRVMVNSLHAQGVDQLAPRARVEAFA